MNDTDIQETAIYELTFLVKEENSAFLKGILEKSGAVISNERPLQKIKLAYPIQKIGYGFIGLLRFSLKPEAVVRLETDLGLQNDLLRHSLTRVIMKSDKGGGETVVSYKAREEKKRPVFVKEPAKNFEPVLTNEALEKKIEEILN